MESKDEFETIPPGVIADLEYAVHCATTGKRPDPEFVRRIAAEAKRIREEVLAKHGVLNVAVDLIREGRDEE